MEFQFLHVTNNNAQSALLDAHEVAKLEGAERGRRGGVYLVHAEHLVTVLLRT